MPPSDSSSAFSPRTSLRARSTVRRLLLAGGALALLGAGLVHRSVARGDYGGPVRTIGVDLAKPDALVRTRSLSTLPRDLLRVPLFRDLLTEEFVFYYEGDPDRLGLQGTLRRIAYEHDLGWKDDFVAWVLDQPAEVALWRASDGRLRHWLISMARNPLARVVEGTATLALSDRQLTNAGTLSVAGRERTILALEHGGGRTMLLVAAGERVVILSDPGLLLGEDGMPRPGSSAFVTRLLSADSASGGLYGEGFRLDASAEHSIVVSLRYASFGYQRYFPGIEALRFDFGDTSWSTYALFDARSLPASGVRQDDLWTALPADPAACALLPVDWKAGASLLKGPVAGQAAVLAAVEGPAAVCWYAQGHLQAPLFVASLEAVPAGLDSLLQDGFAWAVRGGDGPVRTTRVGQTIRWRREVTVPFAVANAEEEPEPGPLDVTLARRGRFVLFSPDGRLVERALATLRRRYPSVADTLPDGGTTLAVLTPRGLADMAKREALLMLPRGQEPLFRNAAESVLLPRLAAMGRYPARRLVLANTEPRPSGWQPVSWQELAR